MPFVRPRLVVTGYARHGKDTVCGIMQMRYGLRYVSSSRFVVDHVATYLSARGINYPNKEAMFNGRDSVRKLWYDAIADYGKGDPARLGTEIFMSGNDIYCGLRNIFELNALRRQGLVDYVIWVDAYIRLPSESAHSITVSPFTDADFILDNNGDENELIDKVDRLMGKIAARGTMVGKYYRFEGSNEA